MKIKIKNCKPGITLIEMLVSMALASVVFIIVGSVLAMFVSQNSRSQRQENFEQTKNDLAQELSGSIRWGKEIILNGNVMTIDGNEYRLDNGFYLKNGQRLNSENVYIRSLEIKNLTTTSSLFGAEINVVMEDRNYSLASDVMRLIVSQRITELEY